MKPEIDESQRPVVLVRWPASITLAEMEAHFEEIVDVALRGERIALVVDMSRSGVPSAKERAAAGQALQRAFDRASHRIAAVAYVVPSVPLRGAMIALHWLAPPPFLTATFGARVEAITWARARATEPRR